MSEKIYHWRRFWCPRASQINLGDRGYLCDPEPEYGHLLNPELVGLEAIADIPCLILLGEPGIGKSQEMTNLFKHTVESIKPSHPPLEINLRSCNSLAIDLIQNPDFIDWNNGEHRLYLFLDSLDEGMLTVGNLATQIADEFNKAIYRNKLDRLYLRIACRTAVFPRILEEGVKKLWKENNTAIYELAPLRRIDVENAAREENIESQEFLSEVWDKTLVPLAIKPLTLRFLLNVYKNNGNQFPSDQTLCSLYLKGCRLLCEENNLSRQGSDQRGKLEADKRLIIAARIAAITVFANRFAIWTGSNQGEMPVEDVKLEQLISGNEFPNDRPIDVTESAIREVLDTGLFSSRGLSRMGWAHQSYSEFLAAWYLKQHNLSASQILNLIIHSDGKVVPQLQETTAWLASMMLDIFQEVAKTDPEILLRCDIPANDYDRKATLVESLLKLHNEDKLEMFRFWRYDKLNHPGLAAQLEAYIRDSTKNQSSRYVAIDIAIDCKEKAVQNCLIDVALDVKQPYEIRKRAAYAICQIGDGNTKAQLKPLALGEVGEDPDDALKGYSFQAIWPQYISAIDLLSQLPQPTTIGIGGSIYQNFIAIELIKYLELSDLSIALKWLETLPNRHDLHYPFINLVDSIMLKAWQNFDEPCVTEAFANVAILKLKRDEEIIGDRPSPRWIDGSEENYDAEMETFLHKSDEKRRKLIETIIPLIPESENNLFWITALVCSTDVLWIIEKVISSKSDRVANIWAEILDQSLNHHNLKWKNTKYIDAIVNACRISSVMRAKFQFFINPIELNLEIANQAKSECLQYRHDLRPSEPESLIIPELKQRVILILEKVESEHPELWWQLPMEMKLIANCIYYNQDCKVDTDITMFPGWVEADTKIQSRIIKAAKTYLIEGKVEAQEWNEFSSPAFAGYQVLYFLSKQESEFISTISSDIWTNWMPVILKFVVFNGDKSEINQVMVRAAYASAPNELVEVLITLMIQRNYQPHISYHSEIYKLISILLDKCLASEIFSKIEYQNLSSGMLEILLSDLFNHAIEEARSITISLISNVEEAREKRLVAAQMIAIHADNSSWSILWSVIQQDIEFGRDVFEAIAFNIFCDNQTVKNLNENYLAELYIFLTQQFSEVKELENQESRGSTFKPMNHIDGIERWKSNIL
jgi:predicted NACHT family NTPase